MNVDIYPLDKVVIDGVPIHLGAEQTVVETAIGKGQPEGKRCYYYNSNMAIDYSADNNEDVENEMRKANHWATIGIGVAGYYQQ